MSRRAWRAGIPAGIVRNEGRLSIYTSKLLVVGTPMGWSRLIRRKRSLDPNADRGHGDVSATNLRLDRPGIAGGACAVDHRGTTCRCRLGRDLFLVDCLCRADTAGSARAIEPQVCCRNIAVTAISIWVK